MSVRRAEPPFSLTLVDCGHPKIWLYLDMEPSESDQHTWPYIASRDGVEAMIGKITDAWSLARRPPVEITIIERDSKAVVYSGFPADMPPGEWKVTVPDPAPPSRL